MLLSAIYLPYDHAKLNRWLQYYERHAPRSLIVVMEMPPAPFPGEDAVSRRALAAEAFAGWVCGR